MLVVAWCSRVFPSTQRCVAVRLYSVCVCRPINKQPSHPVAFCVLCAALLTGDHCFVVLTLGIGFVLVHFIPLFNRPK